MSHLTLTDYPSNRVLRLSGRTLVVARSLWLVVAGLATISFLFALPYRWTLLMEPSPTNLANLTALGLTSSFFATYSLIAEIVIAAPFLVVGLIIFWVCGEERMALFSSLVLVIFGVGSGTFTPTIRALLGLHPAIDFLQQTFEFIAWYGFALFFYLFPNGRFVAGWTRWLSLALLPIFVAWNYAADTPFAPLNWPLYYAVLFIGLLWASWLFSQVYRYRRVSNAIERQQTKWVVFAMATIILVMVLTSILGAFVPGYNLMSEEQPNPQAFAYMLWQWLLSPLMALLPLSIAFSIMRYRLWEIDRLISRAILYGALTVFVVVTYMVIVGGMSVLFQSSSNFFFSLLATGLIAIIFQPLRERLQRFVNRMMFGQRDDPYAVLSHFSQRLEGTLAPDSVLPTIVETVAQTLKLPYTAIYLREGEIAKVAAVFGSPAGEPFLLPLTYQHQLIGEMHVALRAPNESFSGDERRLLEDLAAQTAVAVHNVRLTVDLQRSREQIVAAREEERRRLRRDLHDGLGPKLAGQTLKLEASLDSLDGEPETARALLKETMAESQNIIGEIRRIVYGLRPPALDQLGLVESIREQAAQYQLKGLRVTIKAPTSLPLLPAAVEVAAYRIVQEALTNVARHAQATICTVSLSVERALVIEISDDGRGLPPEVRAGVGLSSMRERAEEIGGSCVIESSEKGGTRVMAHLPVMQGG